MTVGLILTVSGEGLAVQVEEQRGQLHCGGQGLDVFGKQCSLWDAEAEEIGREAKTTWSLALQGV